MPHERIVLIGCGKTKLAHAAAAKDLYVGCLFRARRRYAEASGRRWWILSAKHGLLAPETIIEPYDVRLGDDASRAMFCATRRDALEKWGRQVCTALKERLTGVIATIEVHAGADYAAGLRPHFRDIITPTAGMAVGKQLQFYS